MAQPRHQFEIVGDTDPQPAAAPQQHAQAAAISMLSVALRALAQRTIVALANLFTLFTVGSVFWLWWSIPDPNEKQIVALSIYAGFIIAVNVIVRKSKGL